MNSYYKKLFTIRSNWNSWKQTDISYPSMLEVDIVKLNAKVWKEDVKKVAFDETVEGSWSRRVSIKNHGVLLVIVCVII